MHTDTRLCHTQKHCSGWFVEDPEQSEGKPAGCRVHPLMGLAIHGAPIHGASIPDTTLKGKKCDTEVGPQDKTNPFICPVKL